MMQRRSTFIVPVTTVMCLRTTIIPVDVPSLRAKTGSLRDEIALWGVSDAQRCPACRDFPQSTGRLPRFLDLGLPSDRRLRHLIFGVSHVNM